MPEYSQQELRKLYKMLPKDLKEAIVSEDTAETVWRICQRNEIKEVDIPHFAKLVGDVLMGLLPPPEFERALRSELNLVSSKAKRVSQETTRFIFYPVKEDLAAFYKVSLAPGGRVVGRPAGEAKPFKRKKPSVSDTYREEIE